MIEKNSLSLRPMTDEEWPEWSAGSREEYTLEKMRAEGLTRAEAEKVADDSFASLLPEGIRSPDQFLFGIWDATARLRVGWLWYCLRGGGERKRAWIYDIQLVESVRDRGLGRQTLELLEDRLLQDGVRNLGLHVFGHNARARALYEKFGFSVSNVVMSKTVRVRPRFAPFESTPVPRYGKGAEVLEDCRLIRADRVVGNEAWFERVAEICNEPRVYDLLFRKKLEGQPYRPERARGFLAWGKQGWKYGTHFLFFVNDSNGRLLAALDIKSPDCDDAEIGYWATENSPGVMTAAVERMMSAGREAGYRSLHAYVVPGNQRSIGVLERAGFDSEGLKESRGKPMLRFSKRLT